MREIDGSTAARPTASAYGWMLAGALAFALMGTLAHALADQCDWPVIAIARSTGALLLSGLLAVAGGVRLAFWPSGTLWIRSFAGSISLVCTFYPLTRLPVADVLTLTNMFPIWIALLSWPLLGDFPTPEVWLAIILAFVGVVLMQQPRAFEGSFAALAAMVGSFTTAISMLGLHRLSHVDYRAVVFHFSLVALAVCIACQFWLGEGRAGQAGPIAWTTPLFLVGVGVLAASGQLFLTRAFAAGPPAQVSVIGLMQVPFAMLLDLVIWRRGFNLATLAGIALVVLPTARLILSHASQPRPIRPADQERDSTEDRTVG